MGCDIHLHIEVKINGKWEHYGAPSINRNYSLFEKMAGVRGEQSEAIAPPRGLPEDINALTRFEADLIDSDAHSHSYLTASELSILAKWYATTGTGKHGMPNDIERDLVHCYFFGNSFAGFWDYPDEREDGVEDVRFVFWFDN